jgi:mRNA interferase MazF
VASSGYLDAVTELAIVVPATTTDRDWPQRIQLTGPSLTLARPTFAMTEQPRTISRQRIASVAETVDNACLASIRQWLSAFLHDDNSSR